MLSESARMTTAAQLRFRVQAPNSKPRVTAVIAIDPPGEHLVFGLTERGWHEATFFRALAADPPGDPQPDDGWLITFADERVRLRDAVNAADQVIMVASAGGHAETAAVIGRACSLKRVTTTSLIVGAAGASDADISKTLAQLRPWSLMVVIANSDDYVADMMAALRV